jgi:hypothetical protein
MCVLIHALLLYVNRDATRLAQAVVAFQMLVMLGAALRLAGVI